MKYNYKPLRLFASYTLSIFWIWILMFLFAGNNLFSQNVSISNDGSAGNANSMLDVKSPAVGQGKGLLIPRMTLAQRTVASTAGGLLNGSGDLNGGAAQGLLVYQTDGTQGFYYNTSTTATPAWVQVGTGNSGWALTGNSGTSPATNFVGTIDAQDLVLKTNNTEIMRGLSGGGISVSNVPTGGNALLIDMTNGVAASSTGLRINGFPANGNARTGISVDLTGMQSSSGISVSNVGATSMNGMEINSSANGNGTGLRIGASSTMSTGINIRGGTGITYNALNSGSGTAINIGGTTAPGTGVTVEAAGGGALGGQFHGNSSTTGTTGVIAASGTSIVAGPASASVGLRATANSGNTTSPNHYGVYAVGQRTGGAAAIVSQYGVYGIGAANSTGQSGLAVGVYGTGSTAGNGTTGAFGGLFNASGGGTNLSLAATGGGDVYLGSTDADRPAALVSYLGASNTNTTYMNSARLSGNLILRETAGTTDVVTIAPPADATASYTMTLPSAQGAANSVMVNDGTGLLSWTPPTSFTGFIQNQVASDQAAGFRINGNGLFNGGQVSISNTTATPSANYNLTLAPSAGFSGLNVIGTGTGARAINASASSSSMDAIFGSHSSTSAGAAYYAVGGQIVQPVTTVGYLGYHTSGDNAYALFGNANLHATSWGLFAKGKAAITGNSSPAVGQTADLEIQNVTAAGTPPSTVLLRQTGSNTVAGTTLARIGMGDNHQLGGQARIEAIRDATGGAGDLPTAITFSTTLDNTTTISEQMRISNNGNVGIGTTAVASALLEMSSTSKGLLVPRMTTAQRTSIAAANSLLVFDTDLQSFFYYDTPSTSWKAWLTASSGSGMAGWTTLGNTGTSAATNYVGTTDGTDLVFRTNATERMRLLNNNGLAIASLNNASSTGISIGALSGTTANIGISVGAISGAGATGTGIAVGNISTTGTNNASISLGTLTGATTTNYHISTGTLTSTGPTNAHINLGTTVTTGSTDAYGLNIGSLSGSGTNNFGINVSSMTTSGAINRGISIQGLTGTGTLNTGLFVGAVSGATNNYGIRVTGTTIAANRWAIYSDADAKSYHKGSLGLGTAPTSPNTRLDIDGDVAMREYTVALAAGTTSINDLNTAGYSMVTITGPTGNFDLTGLSGGVNGKIVYLINSTSQNMTVKNNHAASAAANQITTENNADAQVRKVSGIILMYSTFVGKWVVMGHSRQ